MRKLILSLALTAFAASLQAGETNTTANASGCDKAKACCPASSGCAAKKDDKCPAGAEKKAECPKAEKKAEK